MTPEEKTKLRNKFGSGSWTTESEINWLNRIGSTLIFQRFTKLQLLKKYLSACKHRTNWD